MKPLGKIAWMVGMALSLNVVTAEAALTAYSPNGVGLVYSSLGNITWTADGNLFKTLADSYADGASSFVNAVIASVPGGKIVDTLNLYDTPGNSGYHDLSISDFNTGSGQVSWFGAQAWVYYLNSIYYGGSNRWTLPDVGANPEADYNQTGTAFGELFYNELGGTADESIPHTNTFENEQDYAYWLSAEYQPNPEIAWLFGTFNGSQGYGSKIIPLYVWAVTPGQVAAVPAPGAMRLMGTGLIGLLCLKQRGHAG